MLFKFICPPDKYLVFFLKWSPFSYQFSYLRYKWWHCRYFLGDRLQKPAFHSLSLRLWHFDSRLSRRQHRLDNGCYSEDIATSSYHLGCVHCGPLDSYLSSRNRRRNKRDASELQQSCSFESRVQDYSHYAFSVQLGLYQQSYHIRPLRSSERYQYHQKWTGIQFPILCLVYFKSVTRNHYHRFLDPPWLCQAYRRS